MTTSPPINPCLAEAQALFVAEIIRSIKHIEARVQKERPFAMLTDSIGQPVARVAGEEAIVGDSTSNSGGLEKNNA